jgi:hypothetical protein
METRKAEVYYLMEQVPKQLKYTIVHPGGLTNDPGGEREWAVGVDDQPITWTHGCDEHVIMVNNEILPTSWVLMRPTP